MKRILVSITDEQRKWLKANPQYKPSGILQQALKFIMNSGKLEDLEKLGGGNG